ncbi:MAG: phage holin [Clostridiales bacterium]|nr:phage holin [Clostridiales bacterium]
MNWKNRLTNYNFWISIVSAVLLILQALNFEFDIMYINEIATAVLGLLVVIGIVNDPTKTSVKQSKETKDKASEEIPCEEKDENLNDIIQNDIQNTISEMKMESEKLKKETQEIFSDFFDFIIGKTKDIENSEINSDIKENLIEETEKEVELDLVKTTDSVEIVSEEKSEDVIDEESKEEPLLQETLDETVSNEESLDDEIAEEINDTKENETTQEILREEVENSKENEKIEEKEEVASFHKIVND